MRIHQKILKLLVAASALAIVIAHATPAGAQTYNYGNPGVANLSVVNGNVVIVRGDSGAQVAATINAPLVPGDYISTASGSNAEVQFDGISMLRLASNTQVRFVNLSPNSREVQLGIGTADLAELQGADGNPQIDTPSLAVRPNQTGDYRVTVLSNGETLVTVRAGAATIATANGSQTLTPGSTLVAYGSSTRLQNAIGFDSFDQFNISRDQAVVSAYNSNPYLSPQLAGSSNLANYGQWQNVPGYGYAWAPNNQSQTNFAPYQNGQWVWEPGYGYTWVDNAPYGNTTSHYGTWFNNPNYGGWLWQPPANQTQNSATGLASAWLPAVVSFFLSGNNGGSIGSLESLLGGLGNVGNANTGNTNIGWIPLAPGEQYQPWYGQSSSYPPTSVTNVSNITNVYNYYGNARYYRGVTMVPVSAWRKGNFRRFVVVRPQQLRQVVLIRGAVPIVPTTENLHYTSVTTIKHTVVLSRQFAAPRFAAKAPVATHTSFKTQQALVRSIAAVPPKVVPLPPHTAKVEHPVYHPIAHAPIHIPSIVKHTPHPVTTPRPTPHPVVTPKHTPHPVATPKPTPHPVATPKHTPHPVATPKHTPHPVATPKPTPHPVTTPRPTPHPVATPKPTPHPVATPKPTPHPVVTPKHTPHPVAAPKPTPHPVATPKPTPHPVPTPRPTPHPVATPKHTPHPAKTPKPTPRPSAPQSRPV